jgi:hypothetical protein
MASKCARLSSCTAVERPTRGRLTSRGAVAQCLHPDQMPADARLQEVISLLARGFLRSRAARAVDGGEKDLDVLRTPSDVCPEPRSEGESL